MEKEIRALLTKHGFDPKQSLWKHKQSGQLLIKHKDLELIAAIEGITFLQPQVIESDARNGIAVVLVTGKHKEQTAWSFGEASPKNTQQAYPYAMAEKRAKDRVALKLLGWHGHVYSEDEMGDAVVEKTVEVKEEIREAIANANDMDALMDLFTKYGKVEGVKDLLTERRLELENGNN
jgi:hypothetical protein